MPPKKKTRRRFGTMRKKRGRYFVEYIGADGQRHSPGYGFETEQQADIWLTREEERLDLHRRGIITWYPPEVEREQQERDLTTVEEWLNQYHESIAPTVRKSTLDQYKKVTRSRITELSTAPDPTEALKLKDIRLVELTKRDVRAWWDAIVRQFPDQPETNRKGYLRLRAACQEAVTREIIARNPVEIREAGKKAPKEDMYLPEDWEIQAILKEVPERYRALTSLCLFHGVRVGEAVALERGDVEVTAQVPFAPRVTVHIRQNAQRVSSGGGRTYLNFQPTKTAAGKRSVPIMPAHVPIFQRHLAEFAGVSPIEVHADSNLRESVRRVTLFTVTDTGAPVMDTSYRAILNRAKKRAGVDERINPHSGRRWLITRLAEKGAHLKEIGRLLGQDDSQTILQVYMKVRASRTSELIDLVGSTIEA